MSRLHAPADVKTGPHTDFHFTFLSFFFLFSFFPSLSLSLHLYLSSHVSLSLHFSSLISLSSFLSPLLLISISSFLSLLPLISLFLNSLFSSFLLSCHVSLFLSVTLTNDHSYSELSVLTALSWHGPWPLPCFGEMLNIMAEGACQGVSCASLLPLGMK